MCKVPSRIGLSFECDLVCVMQLYDSSNKSGAVKRRREEAGETPARLVLTSAAGAEAADVPERWKHWTSWQLRDIEAGAIG